MHGSSSSAEASARLGATAWRRAARPRRRQRSGARRAAKAMQNARSTAFLRRSWTKALAAMASGKRERPCAVPARRRSRRGSSASCRGEGHAGEAFKNTTFAAKRHVILRTIRVAHGSGRGSWELGFFKLLAMTNCNGQNRGSRRQRESERRLVRVVKSTARLAASALHGTGQASSKESNCRVQQEEARAKYHQ